MLSSKKENRVNFSQIANKIRLDRLQTHKQMNNLQKNSRLKFYNTQNLTTHKTLSYFQNLQNKQKSIYKYKTNDIIRRNGVGKSCQQLNIQIQVLTRRLDEKVGDQIIQTEINNGLKSTKLILNNQYENCQDLNQSLSSLKKNLLTQKKEIKDQIQQVSQKYYSQQQCGSMSLKAQALQAKLTQIQQLTLQVRQRHNKLVKQNSQKKQRLRQINQEFLETEKQDKLLKGRLIQLVQKSVISYNQKNNLTQKHLKVNKSHIQTSLSNLQIQKQSQNCQKSNQIMRVTQESIQNKLVNLLQIRRLINRNLWKQEQRYFEQIQQHSSLIYRFNDFVYIERQLGLNQIPWEQITQNVKNFVYFNDDSMDQPSQSSQNQQFIIISEQDILKIHQIQDNHYQHQDKLPQLQQNQQKQQLTKLRIRHFGEIVNSRQLAIESTLAWNKLHPYKYLAKDIYISYQPFIHQFRQEIYEKI